MLAAPPIIVGVWSMAVTLWQQFYYYYYYNYNSYIIIMKSLDKVEKSSYVLGSELWESKFDGLLSLVKEYIIDVWEIRKHKLYDSDSGPGQQLHSRSSPGERNGKFSQNGKFGQNGKLGHSCTNVTKGKLYGSRDSDHAIVHLGLNVSSSAHNCGCVVDGGNAMAAI